MLLEAGLQLGPLSGPPRLQDLGQDTSLELWPLYGPPSGPVPLYMGRWMPVPLYMGVVRTLIWEGGLWYWVSIRHWPEAHSEGWGQGARNGQFGSWPGGGLHMGHMWAPLEPWGVMGPMGASGSHMGTYMWGQWAHGSHGRLGHI